MLATGCTGSRGEFPDVLSQFIDLHIPPTLYRAAAAAAAVAPAVKTDSGLLGRKKNTYLDLVHHCRCSRISSVVRIFTQLLPGVLFIQAC